MKISGIKANNVSLKSTYTTILTSTITVMITASNTVKTYHRAVCILFLLMLL